MILGRVVGNLVATAKYPTLEGKRFLLVQPCNGDGTDCGKAVVATDAVGAGSDEFVMLVESREASMPIGGGLTPTDLTVVGIVDSVGR